MTAVEFLAERYNYITWLRNRDEISAGYADKLRATYLKEAKEMEEQQLNKAWQEGVVTAQDNAVTIPVVAGQSEQCSGCNESTGETKLWCCNHCGKRIEDF